MKKYAGPYKKIILRSNLPQPVLGEWRSVIVWANQLQNGLTVLMKLYTMPREKIREDAAYGRGLKNET